MCPRTRSSLRVSAAFAVVVLASCGGGGGGGDAAGVDGATAGTGPTAILPVTIVAGGTEPAPTTTPTPGPGAAAPAGCEKSFRAGFSGNTDWQAASGGASGGNDGGYADGDGGIGVGGALGQFRNATVVVARADGTVLGQATTGSDGMITARLCGEPGPLLIEIKGGPATEYFDEGLQAFVPFPEGQSLRAYVPAVVSNIGVTPFTDAAWAIAAATQTAGGPGLVPKAVGPTAEQIRAANERVRAALNRHLTQRLQVADITRLPAIVSDRTRVGAIAATPGGVYGLVNAAFSEQVAAFNPAVDRPTIEAARQLRADLADGRLDGRVGSTAVAGAASRSYDPSRFGIDLNSAIGAVAFRYGADDARALLPEAVSFANCGYDRYLYDAQLGPDGRAYSRVQSDTFTDANASGPKFGGEPTLLNPAGAPRVDTIFANMRNGSLFAKGRSAPRTTVLLGIGDNVAGELGTGTTGNGGVPASLVPVGGVVNPTHVAGGIRHTLARQADGRVLSWGDNGGCALGVASGSRSVPGPVALPADAGLALSVAAVGESSYALTDTGRVLAWGANFAGSLGDGTNLATAVAICTIRPVLTGPGQPLTDVVSIAAGGSVAMALRGDGAVFTWGNGQTFATRVAGLPSNVVKVATDHLNAAGSSQAFAALGDDGVAWIWGRVERYREATDTGCTGLTCVTDLPAPVRVDGLPPVRDLLPGGYVRLTADSSSRYSPSAPRLKTLVNATDYAGRLWAIAGVRAVPASAVAPVTVDRPSALTCDVVGCWASGATQALTGGIFGIGPDDRISIERDGVAVGIATIAQGRGSWSFNAPLAATGDLAFAARVLHAAGHRSASSEPITLRMLTAATPVTTLVAPSTPRGGSFSIGGQLNVRLAAGQRIVVARSGGGTGGSSGDGPPVDIVVDPARISGVDGVTWSTGIVVPAASQPLVYRLAARVVDANGTPIGPPGASVTVTVLPELAAAAFTQVLATVPGAGEVAIWSPSSPTTPITTDTTPTFVGSLSSPLFAGADAVELRRCPAAACSTPVALTPFATVDGLAWRFTDTVPGPGTYRYTVFVRFLGGAERQGTSVDVTIR